MLRQLTFGLAALSLSVAMPLGSAMAKDPDTWDNLQKVRSKRFDRVYLLPEADFRSYTKIMLDPTEVAFQKNWLRDYNSDQRDLSRRISNTDAQKVLDDARAGFEDSFKEAYAKAGYQVVDQAGADVLRVRTAVINITVNAPDTMSPGRVRSFSREAGGATLVLEARDSVTGAVLGRAVDSRDIGDTMPYYRTSVSNRADFKQAFDRWAKISVDGLAELKAISPVDTNGVSKAK
jgi:hypothetical protein